MKGSWFPSRSAFIESQEEFDSQPHAESQRSGLEPCKTNQPSPRLLITIFLKEACYRLRQGLQPPAVSLAYLISSGEEQSTKSGSAETAGWTGASARGLVSSTAAFIRSPRRRGGSLEGPGCWFAGKRAELSARQRSTSSSQGCNQIWRITSSNCIEKPGRKRCCCCAVR